MRKQIFCLVVLLLFFGANGSAQQTSSATQVTVIRAGKLIDVDAGRVQANQMILVRSGKIESMGENLPIPSGATATSWNLGRKALAAPPRSSLCAPS